MTTSLEKLIQPFRNQRLVTQALTHKSFHNENLSESLGHNERLEFLGDAVLGLALSDILMREFPDLTEGDLSKMRASLVNETILAGMAREYELDRRLRLGRGEVHSGGAQKPRLLASVFEAFIGALFLDQGFPAAHSLLEAIFASKLKTLDPGGLFFNDYKTRLQELSQEQLKQAPSYSVLEEIGPDHDKSFIVEVRAGDRVKAQGQGRSKKQAEQEAARRALEEWPLS